MCESGCGRVADRGGAHCYTCKQFIVTQPPVTTESLLKRIAVACERIAAAQEELVRLARVRGGRDEA